MSRVSLTVVCCGALLLLAGVSADPEDQPWRNSVVLYALYPRSFKDSDGDGVGDLKGVLQRRDYLYNLGVRAMFMNPILESPMKDYGYDISNYREIDPLFGTMDDFLELLQALRQCGIKMLMDLVPNHTSDEHEWFLQSEDRIDPYTDYYVWADGKLDPETNATNPPNNWLSVFAGIAWEWSEKRQQYYLHQFSVHQPDLNFTNPTVVKEMDDIIRYWLDKGVDGFRVDAAGHLFEDPELKDEPSLPGTNGSTYQTLDHTYTQNLPTTYDLARHWDCILNQYTKKDGRPRLFLIEAYANLSATVEYFGPGELRSMQPFVFQLLTNGSPNTRATEFKDIIDHWLEAIPTNATTNWLIGNHDQSRAANRFGPEMVDAMNMLTGCLPGIQIVYNGEEIGMQDTYIRFDQTVDPAGQLRGPSSYQVGSRDPGRTPMQWDDSPSAGFSSNSTTWLPVNPNYHYLNVAQQSRAARSHLKVFQDMARARLDPVFQVGTLTVLAPDSDTLVVCRELEHTRYVLVINMGSSVTNYTSQSLLERYGIDDDYTVNISSVNANVKQGFCFNKGSVEMRLRPKSAVLLRTT